MAQTPNHGKLPPSAHHHQQNNFFTTANHPGDHHHKQIPLVWIQNQQQQSAAFSMRGKSS
jgi:hypothetical protein